MLGWKRDDLVWALYWQEPKGLLKLILKISPEEWDRQELGLVLRVLGSRSWCELARMVPRVSMTMLMEPELATEIIFCQGFCRRSLIDLESNAPLRMARDLIRDTLNMADEANLGDARRQLRKCGSLGDLRRVHDRITLRYRRHERLTGIGRHGHSPSSSLVFPPPPVPEDNHIVPITSPERLFAEGEEMEHCVASYANKVAAGLCYIYKVLSPERATLELCPQQERWLPRQLFLAKNKEPSPETWQRVWQWLNGHGR